MAIKTLAVWAGSSPAPQETYAKGLLRLSELEIPVFIPEEIKRNATKAWSKTFSYLAGSDEDKISAFLKILKDKSISDIVCVRGGYGTLRLLPLLDKLDLKKFPRKRIWGFSDYTTLQNYLYDKYQWPWVHSPMITGSSFQKPNKIEKSGWPQPFGRGSRTLHPLKAEVLPQSWKKKSATLLGGNLACLVCLLGTQWEPKPNEKFFLFIEDVSEAPRFIDRYMHQLIHSQYFKNCIGILTGHFTDSSNASDVIYSICSTYKIPLFSGILAGHESPNLPLPMGLKVEVELKAKKSALLKVPELKFE